MKKIMQRIVLHAKDYLQKAEIMQELETREILRRKKKWDECKGVVACTAFWLGDYRKSPLGTDNRKIAAYLFALFLLMVSAATFMNATPSGQFIFKEWAQNWPMECLFWFLFLSSMILVLYVTYRMISDIFPVMVFLSARLLHGLIYHWWVRLRFGMTCLGGALGLWVVKNIIIIGAPIWLCLAVFTLCLTGSLATAMVAIPASDS